MGELYHYGVKGMKWGVRRRRGTGVVSNVKRMSKAVSENDEQRREQMKAISRRKDVAITDKVISRYARKSPAQRMAQVTVNSAVKEYVNSKTQNRGFSVKRTVSDAANNFAVKELQAQSLSKKYNPDGSGEGSKNKVFTKELGIALGYNAARGTMKMTVGALTGTNVSSGKSAFDSLGDAVMNTPYDDLLKK